jgi:hypothetical protein
MGGRYRLIGRLMVGLARTIYIRCVYRMFGREIIGYTVIYGDYTRFWPTLVTSNRWEWSEVGSPKGIYKTWVHSLDLFEVPQEGSRNTK